MFEITQGGSYWVRSGLCIGTPQDIYLVIVKSLEQDTEGSWPGDGVDLSKFLGSAECSRMLQILGISSVGMDLCLVEDH